MNPAQAVRRLDTVLERLESLLLEGEKILPDWERDELEAILLAMDRPPNVPKRTVQAHELALDLQEPLLLALGQRHRVVRESQTRYD